MQNALIDDEYRYVVDPVNPSYVIDMRHLLFVGVYLGRGVGAIIEEGQAIMDDPSARKWQDYWSNALGDEFRRYMVKKSRHYAFNKNDIPIIDLCLYLQSSQSYKLRPRGGNC